MTLWRFLERIFDFDIKFAIGIALSLAIIVVGSISSNANHSNRDDAKAVDAIESIGYKYTLVIAITISFYQIIECFFYEMASNYNTSTEFLRVMAMLLTVFVPSISMLFYGVPQNDYKLGFVFLQSQQLMMLLLTLPSIDMILPRYRKLFMASFSFSLPLSTTSQHLRMVYMVSSDDIRASFGFFSSFTFMILYLPLMITLCASCVVCYQHLNQQQKIRALSAEEKKSAFRMAAATTCLVSMFLVALVSGSPKLENFPVLLFVFNWSAYVLFVTLHAFYHAHLTAQQLASYKVCDQ